MLWKGDDRRPYMVHANAAVAAVQTSRMYGSSRMIGEMHISRSERPPLGTRFPNMSIFISSLPHCGCWASSHLPINQHVRVDRGGEINQRKPEETAAR